MVIELTKASKEEILNHIIKQAGKRALKVAVCVAVILFVFFFVIKSPRNWDWFDIITRLFPTIVISLLVFGFTFIISGNKQADKYGFKDDYNSMRNKSSRPLYVSSFESNQPSTNPATGLSMHGGTDSAGNPYGCHR